MIIPITPINKKPVPLPAKNGNGKKVFLLNRFFNGSIAKNGIVVTIIIRNTKCHNLTPAVRKDFMKPLEYWVLDNFEFDGLRVGIKK